jgi:hypothetical protein
VSGYTRVSAVYEDPKSRRRYAVNVAAYANGNPMPVGVTVHRFARPDDAEAFRTAQATKEEAKS